MSETYKKRITDFLSSILMPRTVRTNNCDGLIHLLACLTMLIDHSGKVLFGNMAQMRIIGRLAFPLFAYSLAAGVVFTHDSRKYLTRIVLLALISQPFYALGLLHTTPAMFAVPFLKNPLGAALTFYLASWQTPSILLSLSLALCILIALRDRNYILAIGVYVLCERFGSAFDYRIGGIQMILLFYFTLEHPVLMTLCGSAYLISWAHQLGSSYSFFGIPCSNEIFALPSILLCAIPMPRFFRLPKAFSYIFYPLHAILLWLLHTAFIH